MYIDTISQKSKKILELKDFRDIYDELLEGEILDQYKPDGKYFRNGFVRIGSESETVHVPPTNEKDVLVALTNLMDFMNSHDIDPVLKSLVTHFMFENTHPFYDGNGRTGRYLLSSYISSKVDKFSGLSIATAIRQHNSKYYRTFKQAGNMFNRADLTIFLEDMLDIIVSGQEDVIQDLIGKKEKLDIIDRNLNENSRFSSLGKTILYMIAQSQLFNIVDSTAIEDREIVHIINQDKISVANIQKEIKKLTNEDILIQTSKSPSRHIISKELWRELLN